MKIKIVSDSSSDLLQLEDVAYATVPLKIITDEKEYIDNIDLDVNGMIDDLKQYKGKSQTSCPNADEWKQSFGDADWIFCVTITSGLSGSCNAANMAVREFLQEHPEKKAHVVDTLSAGPETALIVEKVKEYIVAGMDFEEIVKTVEDYKQKTHLLFSLGSLRNLANNGRISVAAATISGILNIRVVGTASEKGTLEVIGKAKGGKKALVDILNNMLKNGYFGGKVRIHHCENPEAAKSFSEMILKHFPQASVQIGTTRGLCSFYAESGGLLVGYES